MIKGLRAGVGKTRDIVIGGKNPTNINFVHIGNQAQFIDTIKYFQQSLAALAGSLTSFEKAEISKACENYLLNDPNLSKKFLRKKNEFLITSLAGKEQFHMNLQKHLIHYPFLLIKNVLNRTSFIQV